jgi:arylformamidase
LNIYRDLLDIQTLEREYSPSSCIGDIREFTEAYTARSEAVRDNCPDRLVVQYGASVSESLDFFPAPSTRKTGECKTVLVYIHGGYWQELSKEDHSFLAAALHRHDISYIAIGYALAPAASLDVMVAQVRSAIVWIAENYSSLAIDPEAIHLSGSSAGAHLAAMTGLTEWEPLGLAASPICSLTLLSGIFDLRPLILTYVNDAVRMSENEAIRNSPLLVIDTFQGEFPPTLIVFGDNETSEFKRQSTEFFDALTRKGYMARLQEISGRNHFNLPFDLAEELTTFGAISLQHFARSFAGHLDLRST